jgi:hypothetical protein
MRPRLSGRVLLAGLLCSLICNVVIAQGRGQGNTNPPDGLLDGAETPHNTQSAQLPVFDVVSIRLDTRHPTARPFNHRRTAMGSQSAT